jgi:hypothetical protein
VSSALGTNWKDPRVPPLVVVVVLSVPRPVPATTALKVWSADTKTSFLAACVSTVTPPCASMVKTSPAPPVYVICSSLAGEFWFSATVVHVPTRQGSIAAANVALGAEVALGDVVDDPPQPATAMTAGRSTAISSLETIADRVSIRWFIANMLLLGMPAWPQARPAANFAHPVIATCAPLRAGRDPDRPWEDCVSPDFLR